MLIYYNVLPIVAAEWLVPLFRNQEVVDSNFGHETDQVDWEFRGFS
jgi:hypothetical protein